MNSKTQFLAAVLMSLATGMSQAFAQQDQPTTGDFVGDARIIITSNKGDLRVWAHPPRVVVITSDPFVVADLQRIRDRIEHAVSAPYGEKFFGDWHFVELSPDFAQGYDPLKMRLVKGGPAGHQIDLRLGAAGTYLADIVIAVANRPMIAVLNGLWGLTPNYTKAQMEGRRAKCYYSSRSTKGTRLGAYVSIVTSGDQNVISECLWEEVLHTLGPLIDAIETPFFTFDNRVGSSLVRKANDIALIRALYESGARPGDPPDVALAFLAKLARDTSEIGLSALEETGADDTSVP